MLQIIDLQEIHWEQVKEIYEEGIATGIATFQTEAPKWEEWDVGHIADCRFVAIQGDKVVGWTALSPFSSRAAYSGVAEVSIYVRTEYKGKGIGKLLLNTLIKASEVSGFWTLQASIFQENIGSIHLHKQAGFREVGVRERISKLNGRWRNVLLFERRSSLQSLND